MSEIYVLDILYKNISEKYVPDILSEIENILEIYVPDILFEIISEIFVADILSKIV